MVEITRQEQYASEIGLRHGLGVRHVPESDADRAKDRSVEFSCGDNVESLIRMHQKKQE